MFSFIHMHDMDDGICMCMFLKCICTTRIHKTTTQTIGTKKKKKVQHCKYTAWRITNCNQSYNSKIVGTSLGKAAFNCVRVTRPTIWPKASTEDMRTCSKPNNKKKKLMPSYSCNYKTKVQKGHRAIKC